MTRTCLRPFGLLLPACLLLAACARNGHELRPAFAPTATVAPTRALDQHALPPLLRFTPLDLDAGVHACADLNAHVNGRWLAAHAIPDDRSSWGAWDSLIERSLAVQQQLARQAAAEPAPHGVDKIVADFWTSGMDAPAIDAAGLAPLRDRLDAIDALADGAAVAGYLRRSSARGENLLFTFFVGADFKDPTSNIAYATQGGLGLPDRGYYVDADKQATLAAYQAHVATVLELAGAPAATAARQAAQIIAFESRLAQASRSTEDIARDVSLYYHPLSPAAADRLTPNFAWTAFFTSQGIAAPPMFSLAIPAFHEEASRMLGDVPVATWRTWLRWRTLDAASPYLGDAFVEEHFAFHDKTLAGQARIKPREKRVLATINAEAGEALGQLYADVALPAAARARMQALVDNLHGALGKRLENLDWMSAQTRRNALAKHAAFVAKIGYPDRWRDWSGLATTPGSYAGNVFAARAFNHRWNLGKIGQPVDRGEWLMPPQAVNGYYFPLTNEIAFTAAILQPPYFDMAADDALNYGAIGAVIGHEMIHAYDDQGSRFGPTGAFEDWWSEADRAAFEALGARLVEQFDAYETLPGVHVNGRLTLGENIADLGGLAVAWDALQAATAGTPDPMIDGLSRAQRFFIGFATAWRAKFTPEYRTLLAMTDPHAPDDIRAIAAPSNLPAFAHAFGCKAGDAMVRPAGQQVRIW